MNMDLICKNMKEIYVHFSFQPSLGKATIEHFPDSRFHIDVGIPDG